MPEVIQSPDASYLARIEFHPTKDKSPLWVRIFKFERDRQYVFVNEIALSDNERLPYRKLLSNDGRYVSLGKWIVPLEQEDQVRIYDRAGKLAYTIEGKDVFTRNQLAESVLKYETSDLCTPTDPWICWDDTPAISADNQLQLADTLGGFVTIDLQSGRVRRREDSGGSCTLFDRQSDGGK